MKGGPEVFITKSRERFGNKYSFPDLDNEYENSHSKITIKCNDCGSVFTKIACDHITSPNGGCRKCSLESKRTYYSYDELQEKTIYNIVPFKDKVAKNDFVTLLCERHGEYRCRVSTILDGRGMCGKCNPIYSEEEQHELLEYAKEKLQEIYNDKFTIDFSNFKKLTTKLKFTCNDCGKVVYRSASMAINGYAKGCRYCSSRKQAEQRIKTTEDFVSDAQAVHGDKYDYSLTEYASSNQKVKIKCKECGRIFEIEANSHLQGHGCPYHNLNKSTIEDEVYEYLSKLYDGTIIKHDRSVLSENHELDIYIPNAKMAIECDGIFWHNELNKPNDYHLKKTEECGSKGVRLIHIFEDEWKDKTKQSIWKSMLKNIILKTNNKIFARKCETKPVSGKEAREFLDSNHIQGKCNSIVNYGLYYDGELVSLMTFGHSRHFIGNGKSEWELLRFCNRLDTTVVGGASKLLKKFVEEYKPKEIISFADKRWSVGKLYETLGFEKYNESKPNYYYVIKSARKNRFNFRKSQLVKKYGCPEEMSEKEFCLSKKWYRIYDCGCLCYKKTFDN